MSYLDVDWRRMLEFDQSKLQDFAECPRRFELRYLIQQQWPAPAAEPLSDLERSEMLGKRFHLLMERHWLELPVEHESLDPDLQHWWDAFLKNPPPINGNTNRPEVYTSVVLDGHRISATFDLISDDSEMTTIIDWKTGQRRPTRAQLDRRMQTVVYPFVLVEAAPRLLGHPVPPERLRLIYWFANHPTTPEIFRYSAGRYDEDRRTLTGLIDRILKSDSFPLTEQTNRCQYCQYRSLNDRGKAAGILNEADLEFDLLDLGDDLPETEVDQPMTDTTTEPNEFWL